MKDSQGTLVFLVRKDIDDKSQLAQTNPRDALPHTHRVVHKGGRSVW